MRATVDAVCKCGHEQRLYVEDLQRGRAGCTSLDCRVACKLFPRLETRMERRLRRFAGLIGYEQTQRLTAQFKVDLFDALREIREEAEREARARIEEQLTGDELGIGPGDSGEALLDALEPLDQTGIYTREARVANDIVRARGRAAR